jgi:hypothetical protein
VATGTTSFSCHVCKEDGIVFLTASLKENHAFRHEGHFVLVSLVAPSYPQRHLSQSSLYYASAVSYGWWGVSVLVARGVIEHTALQLLIEMFGPSIIKFGDQLGTVYENGAFEKDRNADLPVIRLGIAETGYAVISTRDSFLDLNTGDVVETMPKLPVETRVYDLTALFLTYLDVYRHPQSNSAEREEENNDRRSKPWRYQPDSTPKPV